MTSSNRLSPESHIRLRLLNRLGIHKKEPPITVAMEQRRKHSLYNNNRTALHTWSKPVPFCQPLKEDDDDEAGSSEEYSTPPQISASPYQTSLEKHEEHCRQQQQQKHQQENEEERDYDRSHRRIQFNNNVMVVPIPSRHAYSKRIKQAFWMGGAEIQANAERNRYEFASEGWDFHSVLEDEDFYVDTSTGQLVHPCWVEDEEFDYVDENHDDNGGNVDEDGSNGETTCEECHFNFPASTLKRTNSGVYELQILGTQGEKQQDSEVEENVQE
jgi:hypothetical protein